MLEHFLLNTELADRIVSLVNHFVKHACVLDLFRVLQGIDGLAMLVEVLLEDTLAFSSSLLFRLLNEGVDLDAQELLLEVKVKVRGNQIHPSDRVSYF